jgi:hypothetical protein
MRHSGLLKGTAGGTIPWHWHTPTEQVMIVRFGLFRFCQFRCKPSTFTMWMRTEAKSPLPRRWRRTSNHTPSRQ